MSSPSRREREERRESEEEKNDFPRKRKQRDEGDDDVSVSKRAKNVSEQDGDRDQDREKDRDQDIEKNRDQDRERDRDRDDRDRRRDRDDRDRRRDRDDRDRRRDRDDRDRDIDRDDRDRRRDRDDRDRDRDRDRDFERNGRGRHQDWERRRNNRMRGAPTSESEDDDERTKRKRRRDDWRGRKERREDYVPKKKEQTAEEAKVSMASKADIAKESAPTGGLYIPPWRLALMKKNMTDKSSKEYQKMTWEALRKSINGLINKVNVINIQNILPELIGENIVRGRGLLARSVMKAQTASPVFTHVYAALVAVINTKFPETGELILCRVIDQFRKGFRRNDKINLLASTRFIAHLLNQQIAAEVLGLQVLELLLTNPTDDSVEVACTFMKEYGAMLQEVAPQGFRFVFDRFRGILHEGQIDKRVQYMIEGLMVARKKAFSEHESVIPELDLVEEEDQITHSVGLDAKYDVRNDLNYFHVDENFVENEAKYAAVRKELLGGDDGSDGSGSEGDEDYDSDDESEEEEEKAAPHMEIEDRTGHDAVELRLKIYLTIMSSVDFEECAHKIMLIKLAPGQEQEVVTMIFECCSQERTYIRFYGLLAQRLCDVNRVYQELFDEAFQEQYATIHRLETNKLRNVSKLFAHLFHTDSMPWTAMSYIRLTETDTTASSRIFIKILFQEIAEFLGLRKLNEKLTDEFMGPHFVGLFPKDNPKNTRFAINFWTSIGLGGLTDALREHRRLAPKMIMNRELSSSSSDTSSSDSDSDSSDSDSDSSDSDSSDSDSSDSDSSDSDSSDSDSD